MIYAFTGKTGSGKTYNMVKTAFKHWKKGTNVFSNIPLFFDKNVKNYNNNRAKFGRIEYFTDISDIIHVKNGIILFDEAQVLFNARHWESLPPEFSYKMQQHRKHGLHLFCTTQNLGTIDINYRRLIQGWQHCEQKFQIGVSPFILCGLFFKKTKDIDELYNNIDDIKVNDLKVRPFLIGKWSKTLYDTMFDIGFKRLKSHYLTMYIPNKKTKKVEKREVAYLLPKDKQFNFAQKDYKYFGTNF